MNRETNNFVAFIGLLAIVAIMMAPVDQYRVASDLEKMGPRVANHFSDCPKVNFNIAEAGGVVPYYMQRSKANQEWQKTYYANRNHSRNQVNPTIRSTQPNRSQYQPRIRYND